MRIAVAVLFGGPGPEHSISCESARGVLSGLESRFYAITPIYVGSDGHWYLAPRQLPPLGYGIDAWAAWGEKVARGLRVHLVNGTLLTASDAPTRLDVAFPVLHGPYGEGGTVQGLLEGAGVRYVGSGVRACVDSIDKDRAKRVARGAGIPVGRYVLTDRGTVRAADRGLIGLPAFVKPARGGSSFGITRIVDWEQLDEAVTRAAKYDEKVLVEAAIGGREISIGVLEGEQGNPPDLSVASEALFAGHDWYDYTAKYLDPTCEIGPPDGVAAPDIERMQAMARTAFDALGCSGLARVDFFHEGPGKIYFNEVNTMPGLTPLSFFPEMWQRSGMNYQALLVRLIAGAMRPKSTRSRTDGSSNQVEGLARATPRDRHP